MKGTTSKALVPGYFFPTILVTTTSLFDVLVQKAIVILPFLFFRGSRVKTWEILYTPAPRPPSKPNLLYISFISLDESRSCPKGRLEELF